MWVKIACDRECVSAVGRYSNLEAVVLEKHLENFCRVYVVVHNQNSLP